MPVPTTVDELLDVVRKSGLLEPARLDAILASTPAGFAAPDELAARLVADGLLTPFHTGQLLRGKHKGFFLGRYKILDRIGLGGMGQVFLAEHGAMRRRAALKVLPPDRAENQYSRERFLREARASGQLDHPNLVRAFDFDQDGDVIFLVMEYVDGVTFHDLVMRTGPLDPVRAAHYVLQAAQGLAYLHDRGLIHRDIKPANLLVDRQGVVKVLDLGLVRSETDEDNLTRGEGVKILGTADFLPPEQAIDCSSVDTRADVYGLGATAYFLLTGRPPFEGEKVAQKLIAHQLTPVRPVHEVRPDVPEGLSDVVTRMLAKRPADRPQTPGEVVDLLAPWGVAAVAPPTEDEIPAVAGGSPGCPGTVNLSGPRSARVGGSAGGSVPGSGSAIRYHSDSKLAAASQSAAAALKLGPPLPPPPVSRSGGPPVLPASATHGARTPPPAAPPSSFPRPAAPRPAPGPDLTPAAPAAGAWLRPALVGLAAAVAVGVGAWAALAR